MMVGRRGEIGVIAVNASFPLIVPLVQKVFESVNAFLEQPVHAGIARLNRKIVQAQQRPEKTVHDAGRGKTPGASV